MAWQACNLNITIPEPVKVLADAAGTLSGGLETSLAVIQGLINLIKPFYEGSVDPAAALFNEAINQAETMVGDLFGSGVYQLIVTPVGCGHLPGDKSGFPLLDFVRKGLWGGVFEKSDFIRF